MPLPNSLGWMESVDAKLSRAQEHLNALEAAVADHIASTKRKIILKLNQDQSLVSLMTWVDDPYPPIRISAIVGDCLFNSRGALDNLICGLVRVGRPATTCRDLGFPILTDPDRWDSSSRKLRGIPDDAKKLVKAVQPFNRPPNSVKIDPLYILNTLRNRDTHQASQLVTGYSTNTRFAVSTNDGRVVLVTSDQPMFGEGSQSIPLAIPPASVTPQARVEAAGNAVIAFRDDGPWGDRSVVDVLSTCLRYVRDDVVRQFTRFFMPRT